jgi:hypothetical protein
MVLFHDVAVLISFYCFAYAFFMLALQAVNATEPICQYEYSLSAFGKALVYLAANLGQPL